jgi:hypothetical protein
MDASPTGFCARCGNPPPAWYHARGQARHHCCPRCAAALRGEAERAAARCQPDRRSADGQSGHDHPRQLAA